jgi:hypothetical protein
MKKYEVMGCVKDIGDLHTKVWLESMKEMAGNTRM